MLIEYNELMTTAGLGHIAMEQMVRHNPNPTTYEFPDSMMTASSDAKREYIKGNRCPDLTSVFIRDQRSVEPIRSELPETRTLKTTNELRKLSST